MTRHILITGATGKTGAFAVSGLLEQGHEVRALVHRDDARAERLAESGAEVVVGDLLDLDAVTAAAKGTDAAYLTYPILPGLIEATATLLQAAETCVMSRPTTATASSPASTTSSARSPGSSHSRSRPSSSATGTTTTRAPAGSRPSSGAGGQLRVPNPIADMPIPSGRVTVGAIEPRTGPSAHESGEHRS